MKNYMLFFLLLGALVFSAPVFAGGGSEKPESQTAVESGGPLYGGTLTWIQEENITGFDRTLDGTSSAMTVQSYYGDTLLICDWWEDPERKITTFSDEQTYAVYPDRWTGSLAESWESSDPLKITFKLRKGVKWQNKAPMNGREFVAEDVKWNYEFFLSQPLYSNVTAQNIKEITCPDKYTVVFTFKKSSTLMLWTVGSGGLFFMPPEIYQQGGDLRDWKKVVGTGPYMLTDYVADSVCVYERNPDYFGRDPDGNQLPYIDKVNALIVMDPASRVAALRTAQVDMTGRQSLVGADYLSSLKSTNPELQWEASSGAWWILYFRTVDEPWNNLKVRQACATAINFEEINNSIFDGTGNSWTFPARSTWPIWTPLDQMPAEIKSIYKWTPDNPQKAKKLLAEAGYPNGVDATVQYFAGGTNAIFGDAIQLVKEYWDAVGIKTTLVPIDNATQSAIKTSKVYNDLFATITGGAEPISNVLDRWGTGGVFNRALVSDPYIDQALVKAAAEFNVAKQNQILKDLYNYLALQVHHIAMPSENQFIAWYPWVKNYHGEININTRSDGQVAARIWIDQKAQK